MIEVLFGAVALFGLYKLLRHGSTPSVPSPTQGLRPAMLDAALELLPEPASVLEPPSPAWDGVLGGRIGEIFGAPAWRYYAVRVGQNPDGSYRKGGTTCGIFTAYCAAKAGWPIDWINRAPDDKWAPGSGFTPGAHISKLLAGAKKAGWWIPAPTSSASGPANIVGDDLGASFELQPGDYYHQNHDGATYNGKPADGSHVGIIFSVSSPDARGFRQVVTLDGGDTNAKGEQCAKRHTRTLSPQWTLTYAGTESRLVGIVRRPASV